MSLEDQIIELTLYETPATKASGALISSFVGILSAISSIVIIVIISRSNTCLSSPYHRILFGMSLADVFSALAMAFTTLPMPKDMIFTQYEGRIIGNTLTCTIQGFTARYFGTVTFSYNVALCLYYLYAIPLKMPDKKFQKRVEPFVHIGVQVMSLPVDISYLYAKVGSIHVHF